MKLEGKKALITGGDGAIGSAISVELAKEGADVAVCYYNSKDKAKELVKQIQDQGRIGFAIYLDLRNSDSIKNGIQEIVAKLGGIDILINCATAGEQVPFEELTEEIVDKFFETNLRGYFLTSMYVSREMVKQGQGGRIVNIGSISSRGMTSSYVHYGATKGGIEATTRGMAVALGKYNILVNCVAPGCVMTPTVANMFDEPKNADPVNERTPLGRIVTIEECVRPTIFFCSSDSSGITGQTLDVDGGYMVQGMEWDLTDDIRDFRKSLEKVGH